MYLLLYKFSNIIEIIFFTFPNVSLLYMPVENCLQALFYITCGYTTERNFTPVISSDVSPCSMTSCFCRKLPSKIPYVRGKPTKICSGKYRNKKLFYM